MGRPPLSPPPSPRGVRRGGEGPARPGPAAPSRAGPEGHLPCGEGGLAARRALRRPRGGHPALGGGVGGVAARPVRREEGTGGTAASPRVWASSPLPGLRCLGRFCRRRRSWRRFPERRSAAAALPQAGPAVRLGLCGPRGSAGARRVLGDGSRESLRLRQGGFGQLLGTDPEFE